MKMPLGIIIATFAMAGLVLGLSMQDVSRGERSGIVIFSFLVMMFGVLLETPLVKRIQERMEVEGDSGKPPKGWNVD